MSESLSPPASAAESLRWRIPVGSDPQQLRVGLVQLLMASVVATIILLVAMPAEMFVWAVLPLLPLAIGLGLWKWRAYQRSLAGPENVWLDDAGLHWLDAAEQQQTLPRSGAIGFRIAADPETVRRVPALTLFLHDDFESQPFELHEPATPDTVSQLLRERWQLPEERRAADVQLDYDQAVDVYSECHAENYEWHLEGSAAALLELAELIERTPRDFPLPPPAAKPRGRKLLARRGQPSPVRIEHARHVRLDDDVISGPADFLAELAAHFRAQLAADAPAGPRDVQFDIATPPRAQWTFHLHVREL